MKEGKPKLASQSRKLIPFLLLEKKRPAFKEQLHLPGSERYTWDAGGADGWGTFRDSPKRREAKLRKLQEEKEIFVFGIKG